MVRAFCVLVRKILSQTIRSIINKINHYFNKKDSKQNKNLTVAIYRDPYQQIYHPEKYPIDRWTLEEKLEFIERVMKDFFKEPSFIYMDDIGY